MGICFSTGDLRADSYTHLDMSEHPRLTVHFYGGTGIFHIPPIVIHLEQAVTCEEVCNRSALHLSETLGKFFPRDSEKNIGPLVKDLFGLYATDHNLQEWVPDWFEFNSSQDNQEYYFRIKVRLPTPEKIPLGVFSDYLFWQCSVDFLEGRHWQLFSERNKVKTIDDVNVNAIRIFVASANYPLPEAVTCHPTKVLHTPLNQLAQLNSMVAAVSRKNLKKQLPAYMPDELKREYNIHSSFIMRYVTLKKLRGYIKPFYELYQSNCLRDVRLLFIHGFFKEYVPYYCMEYYPAFKVVSVQQDDSRPQQMRVDVIIRPFQDDCPTGLYFNTKLVACLKDILSVKVDESDVGQKCNVSLIFRDRRPLILHMQNEAIAESFVSVLDLYYRLIVNYHSSIREDPSHRPPSLRVLNMLRSYGPMGEKAAREQLRTCERKGAPRYLVYQDCLQFGLLHVVGWNCDTDSIICYDIKFKPSRCDSGFSFVLCHGEEGEILRDTSNPQDVRQYLKTKFGHQIIPKEDEICGAMRYLKQDDIVPYDSPIYPDQQSQRRQRRDADNELTMFTEDQVKVADSQRIFHGQFTDVYRFEQSEQGRWCILKKVHNNQQDVQEAYRSGAERLYKLGQGSHKFISVYGFMFCSPLRIVMESLPEDCVSLRQRLQDCGRCDKQFPWQYVISVLKTLTDCLHYLERSKLIYGSFCCSKILIQSEEETNEGLKLIVQLGDPSHSILCDGRPISDPLNQHRLAWISPERFGSRGHLHPPTIASEVYALGTVLWEMLWLGAHPTHCYLPGLNHNPEQFFKQGVRLQDPPFPGLSTSGGEVSELPRDQTHVRTNNWVAQQNFDTRDNGEGSASGDMNQYQKAALADSVAEPDLVSDQMAVTSEGEAGDGNNTGTQQAPLMATATVTQGESTVEENRGVKPLEGFLITLMHDCWHREPDHRPTPTDLQRRVIAADNLLRRDPSWQLTHILNIARATGNVINDEHARRLGNTNLAGVQHMKQQMKHMNADNDRLKKMEAAIAEEISCFILLDLLEFYPTPWVLGKGEFGVVEKALLSRGSESRQPDAQQDKEPVAVKKVIDTKKTDSDSDNFIDSSSEFLREAMCCHKLDHRNIVKMKGLVMKGHTSPCYMLVMEFADMGSLEQYVRDKKHRLGEKGFRMNLLKLAIDIATGLEYLSNKINRIHADIATRNVVLFSADGGSTCPPTAKLTDFGLSHLLSTNGYYDLRKSSSKDRKPRLPVYAFPPELLRGFDNQEIKFSVKTDVWMFGLCLWEMFTGEKPEQLLGARLKVGNNHIGQHIISVYEQMGRSLPRKDCPLRLYENVMKKCWKWNNPEDRPTFDELITLLQYLTEQDME